MILDLEQKFVKNCTLDPLWYRVFQKSVLSNILALPFREDMENSETWLIYFLGPSWQEACNYLINVWYVG